MDPEGFDIWSASLRTMQGMPQQDERLPSVAVLAEGQVVILARAGEPSGFGIRGPHVFRAGALVAVGEAEARDLLDPSRATERRYADAVYAAGVPVEERRYVEADGHEWEADVAYPADDAGLALILVTRVRGRHVWRRAATYAEAQTLGVTD